MRADYRGLRVGTALIKAAESACLDQGRPQVGVGVSPENLRAVRLYERLGYARTEVSDVSYYQWVDEAGRTRHESECNELFIKQLDGPSAPLADTMGSGRTTGGTDANS